MCLAIFSEGNPIPLDHLISGMENNPHGAGVSFADGRNIITFKGMWGINQLLGHLELCENLPHMVHFRYATSGKINKENCHPFNVGEDYSMCHNGILSWRNTENISDTRCFVNDFLKHNIDDIFIDPQLASNVEGMIGRNNKIILLRSDGSSIILNEDMGLWEDGIWYSNSGFRSRKCEWLIPDSLPMTEKEISCEFFKKQIDNEKMDSIDFRY